MIDMILPPQLAELAERVVRKNAAAGRKLAVAESCTGGLVAAAITDVPGSSDVLECSLVAYSNEAKRKLLGVNEDLIDTFGAVSIAVVWAMAQGVLDRSDADIAVAISGIAGPGGGTAQKPVGTVVFARAERGADPEAVMAEKINFDPELCRAEIRLLAAQRALELFLPSTEAPGA